MSKFAELNLQNKMKNTFKIMVIALLSVAMYSCNSNPKDLELRETDLSNRIDKLEVQEIYRDIMMLYADIIEDVYNKGKDSENFDLSRLEAFEAGIVKDFEDKITFSDEAFWNEVADGYEISLYDRLEEISPYMEEMMGDLSNSMEPEMLEDGSMVIGTDTIKELDSKTILVNGDTVTYE